MTGSVSWLRNLLGIIVLAMAAAAAQQLPDAPAPKPDAANQAAAKTFPAGTAPINKNLHPEDPIPGKPVTDERTPDTLPDTPSQNRPGSVPSSRNDLFKLT